MTKGNSVSYGTRYGNFIRGNKDKLMISYRRETSHDYTMNDACGVLFEGEIHFFGGTRYPNGVDFGYQHFVIETERNGQLVKMTKKEDLEIGFEDATCISFEMTSEYFSWFQTSFVILCFDAMRYKSCYLFDGTLTYIVDSNYEHMFGLMTRYRDNLLTVGALYNQKTEIMKIDEIRNFDWFVVEPDFNFTPGKSITGHSLVTVESSDINKEYVLLLG